MEGKKIKVNPKQKKILILSYYWPPSGGSGVQRWMYFAKHLKQLGHEPIVITVDEKQASYPTLDTSLEEEIVGINVIKTSTREPLRWYSRLISGNPHKGIPQGDVRRKGLFGKLTAYIRGNYFIPDARKGWIPFAVQAAQFLLKKETISHLITTGPPHSTHLAGLQLKEQFKLNWWVDFRDPWTAIFYNASLYRSTKTKAKDKALEKKVLQSADGVLTTVGGKLHDQLKSKVPNQTFVTLPNGYDATMMQNLKAAAPKEEFHIVYTGLLTRNQIDISLLEVIAECSKSHRIYFSLAGNISAEIIKEITNAIPKVRVEYLGYLPHADAVALMKSANLLLNFIFKGAEEQMISGKLLEYMATEVPILSLGDPNSAAGEFIAQGSHSWMVSPEDKRSLQNHLRTLLSAKKPLKNQFLQLHQWSREALTRKLTNILFKG